MPTPPETLPHHGHGHRPTEARKVPDSHAVRLARPVPPRNVRRTGTCHGRSCQSVRISSSTHSRERPNDSSEPRGSISHATTGAGSSARIKRKPARLQSQRTDPQPAWSRHRRPRSRGSSTTTGPGYNATAINHTTDIADTTGVATAAAGICTIVNSSPNPNPVSSTYRGASKPGHAMAEVHEAAGQHCVTARVAASHNVPHRHRDPDNPGLLQDELDGPATSGPFTIMGQRSTRSMPPGHASRNAEPTPPSKGRRGPLLRHQRSKLRGTRSPERCLTNRLVQCRSNNQVPVG